MRTFAVSCLAHESLHPSALSSGSAVETYCKSLPAQLDDNEQREHLAGHAAVGALLSQE